MTPPYVVPVVGRAPFGTRWALVTATGDLVRPPDLTAVGPFHARAGGEGGMIAPAADASGRWGHLDERGHWLARPAWEWAGAFDRSGLSRFRSEGLWGYADTTGTPVVAPRFTDAQPFHHGLAAIRTEEGAGYADPTGRIVIGGYQAAGPFGPFGLAGVRLADTGRCGYVDREGRPAVPARFDGARPFGAGGAAPVRIGERWGLVDTAGEWIVEPSFRMLEPFDENGLAYVIGGRIGASFAGFVDSRGELVLTCSNEMDKVLRCGLLKIGDGYLRGYVDSAGRSAIEQRWSWADTFAPCGAAVARDSEPDRWGVLRTDGSFRPSPYREPLTDDDGWILGFDDTTGLAPFLTGDGAVARVDRDGREVCRVEAAADGATVTLRNAEGRTVWLTAAAPGTFPRERPFLTREADFYVDHTDTWKGDTGAVAEGLLSRPSRPFRPHSLIFDDAVDPYDLSHLDMEGEEGEEGEEAVEDEEDLCHGAMHVVASIFLTAESLTEYPFLHEWTTDRFEEIFGILRARLTVRFGPPLPADEAVFLRYGDGERSVTWRLGDRLLVLQEFGLVGDGDVELQTWLAALDT
ncbi:WG repeat-containing protein [Streptomyces sp. NPDC059355]|uniref:WG repeat-containing protein n=1 Tax=Streptomyces sp. NPDC059355 TaxID=3346811 RepID=UPI0036AD2853